MKQKDKKEVLKHLKKDQKEFKEQIKEDRELKHKLLEKPKAKKK